MFGGRGFFLTIRHGRAPDLAAVRHGLEADPRLLAHGSASVLYAVLNRIVDGYAPVVAGLQNMVGALTAGFDKYGVGEELQRYLRDVADHATVVAERVDGFRELPPRPATPRTSRSNGSPPGRPFSSRRRSSAPSTGRTSDTCPNCGGSPATRCRCC
jgi:Mg2+ and Co2+ transporter CorA